MLAFIGLFILLLPFMAWMELILLRSEQKEANRKEAEEAAKIYGWTKEEEEECFNGLQEADQAIEDESR